MTFDDFIRDLHSAKETLSAQCQHYRAVRVAEAIDLLGKYRQALQEVTQCNTLDGAIEIADELLKGDTK